MKKLLILIAFMFLLTGCKDKEFETISDVYEPPAQQAGEVSLALPEDASVTIMENDSMGKIYLCDGYTVLVETLQAGDLDRTLRAVTGYSKDTLTVMQTEEENIKRYNCVWTCAGEGGNQVCRSVILDDGNFHYAVTVMADESAAGDLSNTWQKILSSASITSTAP